MVLDCAVFENYRNIEHFPFVFDPQVNILYGKNAQGKTNVIEGIYLFGSGKSFRHGREKDLIKSDKNFAQIGIGYTDSVRDHKMSLRLFRDMGKEMFKNGVKIGRMSNFIGNFRAVLFCPEHLSIVKNEPAERRSFLDNAISPMNRSYLTALMEHKKLLEQRNALLKNAETAGTGFMLTMEILSDKLACNAGFITKIRMDYLQRLFDLVNAYMQDMTGGLEKASFRYLSHIASEDEIDLTDEKSNVKRYKEALLSDIRKEILIGSTIAGVHRDDFEIRLNGKNAKIFASQGQQRSLALAMKLAEGEIAREENGEYPVFLLDDVLSELDRERKHYILSRLTGRQVIITTCDENDFTGIADARKIYVENGTYSYR